MEQYYIKSLAGEQVKIAVEKLSGNKLENTKPLEYRTEEKRYYAVIIDEYIYLWENKS